MILKVSPTSRPPRVLPTRPRLAPPSRGARPGGSSSPRAAPSPTPCLPAAAPPSWPTDGRAGGGVRVLASFYSFVPRRLAFDARRSRPACSPSRRGTRSSCPARSPARPGPRGSSPAAPRRSPSASRPSLRARPDVVAFQEVWRARDAERLASRRRLGVPARARLEPKCGLALFSAAVPDRPRRLPTLRAPRRPRGPVREGRAGRPPRRRSHEADDANTSSSNAHSRAISGGTARRRARGRFRSFETPWRKPSRGRARAKSLRGAARGGAKARRAPRRSRWPSATSTSLRRRASFTTRCASWRAEAAEAAEEAAARERARVKKPNEPRPPGSSTSRPGTNAGVSTPRRFRRCCTAGESGAWSPGVSKRVSDAETSGGASGGFGFGSRGGARGSPSDASITSCVEWRRTKPPRTRRGGRARSRRGGLGRTDDGEPLGDHAFVFAQLARDENPVRARVLSVREAAGKSFQFSFDGGMIDSTSNDVSRLLRSPSFLVLRLSNRLESSRVPDDASRRSSLFLRSKVFLFVRFGSVPA